MKARFANSGRATQHGFSLLELLVAFAIMAMSLGLLYRMVGGSARNATDAVQNQLAVWIAESLLATHSSVRPDGWNEGGESAGFRWQVRSKPYASSDNTPLAVRLHRVELSVSWVGSSAPGRLDIVTLVPERKFRSGEGSP